MSPRAAWRLESLGFEHVYDYVAGKADWFASGLPGEGEAMAIPRLGDHARKAPTCRLTDPVGQISKRLGDDGWEVCVVTNEQGVVLGTLDEGEGALGDDPEATAERVMRSGPSTFRPDVSLDEMHGYMHDHGIERALVTTSDGRLVGFAHAADVERETARTRAEG